LLDGTQSSIRSRRALAKATGGELVAVPYGGHAPQRREPGAVNLALRRLVTRAFTADSRELRGAGTVS
jgi:pimeloyl-ACP methyl ester carboxylesterase